MKMERLVFNSEGHQIFTQHHSRLSVTIETSHAGQFSSHLRKRRIWGSGCRLRPTCKLDWHWVLGLLWTITFAAKPYLSTEIKLTQSLWLGTRLSLKSLTLFFTLTFYYVYKLIFIPIIDIALFITIIIHQIPHFTDAFHGLHNFICIISSRVTIIHFS